MRWNKRVFLSIVIFVFFMGFTFLTLRFGINNEKKLFVVGEGGGLTATAGISSIHLEDGDSYQISITPEYNGTVINGATINCSSSGSASISNTTGFKTTVTASGSSHSGGSVSCTVSYNGSTAKVYISVEAKCNGWSAGNYTALLDFVPQYSAYVADYDYYIKGCERITSGSNSGKYKCAAGQWYARCGYRPPPYEEPTPTPKPTSSPTSSSTPRPTSSSSTPKPTSSSSSSSTPKPTSSPEATSTPQPTPTPTGTLIPTKYCEGEDEKNTVTDKIEEDYYEINKEVEDIVKFDMNKDNKVDDVLEIKSGESFTFEIKITSKKTITGDFFGDKWQAAYKNAEESYLKLQKEIKQKYGTEDIDKAIAKAEEILANVFPQTIEYEVYDENGQIIGVREEYTQEYLEAKEAVKRLDENRKAMIEYWNMMLSLENIFQEYNNNYVNMKGLFTFEPTSNLTFNYKVNKIEYIKYVEFLKNEKKSQKGEIARKKDKALDFYTQGATTNGRSVHYLTYDFNYNNVKSPRILYFQPPEQTLNRKTGELGNEFAVNGYTRIYTDNRKVDKGKYDITILIEHLGLENKEYMMVNDKCKLNVSLTELIFRIVDVNNPFINSSYTPGINWRGNRYGYDFTGVINGGTWTGNAEKIVELDNETLNNIRSSNSADTYIGGCYYVNSNDYVCSLIN